MSTKKNQERHCEKVHVQKLRLYYCQACAKGFEQRISLFYHLRDKHGNSERIDGEDDDN